MAQGTSEQPPGRIGKLFDVDHPILLGRPMGSLGSGLVHVIETTSSTQDLARAAARGGAPHGWTVVASEQTAGRGRQGRTWTAPAGSGLLVSVVLRSPGCEVGWTPLAAGLAVARAIELTTGLRSALKWPNDVLLPVPGNRIGAKVAGVLAEIEPLAAPPSPCVVLGVGINLTVPTFPPDARATSLHRHGPAPAAEALLAGLLDELDAVLQRLAGDGSAVRAEWIASAAGLGQPLTVMTPSGELSGRHLGVDADGALLVETADGLVRLIAGDVHLVPT